jgi:hypothetical protein
MLCEFDFHILRNLIMIFFFFFPYLMLFGDLFKEPKVHYCKKLIMD